MLELKNTYHSNTTTSFQAIFGSLVVEVALSTKELLTANKNPINWPQSLSKTAPGQLTPSQPPIPPNNPCGRWRRVGRDVFFARPILQSHWNKKTDYGLIIMLQIFCISKAPLLVFKPKKIIEIFGFGTKTLFNISRTLALHRGKYKLFPATLINSTLDGPAVYKDIIPCHILGPPSFCPSFGVPFRWPTTTTPDVPSFFNSFLFLFPLGPGKSLSDRQRGWRLEHGTGSNNGDQSVGRWGDFYIDDWRTYVGYHLETVALDADQGH